MCGIAGVVSRTADVETAQRALRLTRALVHRGPDGEGFWRAAGWTGELCDADRLGLPADVVLGHRRLSIVDLATGDQPMANEDGTVWVSFNGEIYNQAELRLELERRGHRFATHADTEVLVHGWEEWGTELFGRLNGIFAFALADVRSREVLLVRDPMGVKPLYVGVDGARTWWASELAAAGAAGLASDEVSADALKLFFTFRFIPSPHTIRERAWKLPPGTYVRLRPEEAGREPEFSHYSWRVCSSAHPSGRDEWRDALVAELEAAVKRQLMADVPVASLLSGGVDSSLVTLLMAENLPYAPQTFGIGLPSEGDQSEALLAQQAATELGVPHHTTEVGDEEFVRAWPDILARFGEPIANSTALMVYLICAEVGRSHKVALCGQGADEPLGGYPRHMAERLYRLGRVAPPLATAAARRAFGADSGARLGRALATRDRLDRYVQIFSVLPAEHVDALVVGASGGAAELARAAVSRWVPPERPSDTMNELLKVDSRLSLADDLMIVGDHCAMYSSVELRVPFLDLALVELAERMPSRYKVSQLGERKWLYRQGAARRLPAELSRRLCPPTKRLERKRGFSAPLSSWFDAEDGLLASPEQWAKPLRELEALRSGPLEDAVGRASGGDLKRRRTVLYSLAMWLDGNSSPRSAAA